VKRLRPTIFGKRGRCLACAILLCMGFPAPAHSKPWWPAFQKGQGGSYCGFGQRGRHSVRGSRDGSIVVRTKGPGLRVRLGSNHSSYDRGDVVYARVENRGTQQIFDLPEYQIERQVEERWQRVGPIGLRWPRSPPPILTSGRARCFNFRIPRSASAGRYRVVKQTEFNSGEAGEYASVTLTREFEVGRGSTRLAMRGYRRES